VKLPHAGAKRYSAPRWIAGAEAPNDKRQITKKSQTPKEEASMRATLQLGSSPFEASLVLVICLL
jgi:hypothetical protein